MKKIIITFLFVLMSSSIACADWVDNFKADYLKLNIDQAVANAMKEGIAPALILEEGLKLQSLNPVGLVRALYCAGAPGHEIEKAASEYGVSSLVVATGFKKSVAECGGAYGDTQAYTPVTPTFTPSFAGPIAGGGTVYASPATP